MHETRPSASTLRSAVPVGSRVPHVNPLDAFVVVNILLFIGMCVFTYYARFVEYRGAANVWEFFVYATVTIGGILVLWACCRPLGFSPRLLVAVQLGILAHFAGAFVSWDGGRLYDVVVAGIRYDKVVHFANACVAVFVVGHIITRHGLRPTRLVRMLIALTVVGLGAMVEIVEFLVVSTVPQNGVGGYDNNMQDLMANFAGASAGVGALSAAWRRRIRAVSRPPAAPADAVEAGARRRAFHALEVAAVGLSFLAGNWIAPRFAGSPVFLPLTGAALVLGLVYVTWISPVYVHGDSLRSRGMGPARRFFVRVDNLGAAARPFAWLTLVGIAGILIGAAVTNPTWLAEADWRAWVLRGFFYSMSAWIQAVILVGFLLPRLREVYRGAAPDRARWGLALTMAAIFGGLHAPGVALVGLTAVFGFACGWIASRRPNVLVVAASQAVLGLLVHRVLGLSLRIGYFHDHPDIYVVREIVPFAREIIGTLY